MWGFRRGIERKAFDKAVKNFTYRSDANGAKTLKEDLTFVVVQDTTRRFVGDCDDFAFSLRNTIGGKVWFCFLEGEAHAVLVKDGTVYDFNQGVHKVEDYPAKLLFWADLDGTHGTT